MSFQDFFTPGSVAIVGASRTKGKVGYEIVTGMLRAGFEGDIYPINPKADEIEGLKCHASLEDIDSAPDLVVIVVPAKAVPGVLRQCAKIGSGHAVVISAGFREAGQEGAKLEKEAVDVARRAGIRFVGPNCLGLMCTETRLNASFGGDLPESGKISYMSQSGSILSAILDMSRAERVGFSKLISIGNKADVDELEVLKGFGRDPNTQVIAGYLETIADGDAFIREAENISRKKPILLMKSGETGAGARAASSHTGALAQRQAAFESVFARAGIIRCDSIKSQFDYARALAGQPLPKGPNVAVVANAGGAGIMAVDAIERQGLTLAELAEETREKLREGLPPAANILNPVDVLGDALSDRYDVALNAVLDDPNVHAVLALLTPHAMTECPPTARVVVKAAQRSDKPILASFLGARRMDEAVQILRDGGVPQYDSPESAVGAVKAMSTYARWRGRPKRVVRVFPVNRRKVEQIIQRHLRRKALEIGEMESHDILQAYGFLTPRGNVATSAEQAVSFARQIGYPVVLKIWSPDILHKNEVGGVKVGLTNDQEVMDAFDLMMYRIPRRAPDADILGVLIQEMVSGGIEVILGMHRDERFGPLMMFGMGGIMVEVMKDVSFYLAPITGDEAREMLENTQTYQVLRDRGDGEAMDIDAVAEGLQRLSQLVTEFPQIQEMDINPYVVGPEGTTPIAVDARITLSDEEPSGG